VTGFVYFDYLLLVNLNLKILRLDRASLLNNYMHIVRADQCREGLVLYPRARSTRSSSKLTPANRR
jgi:hypothetical protein